jgi:two-component system, cell cycle response regulator DivK
VTSPSPDASAHEPADTEDLLVLIVDDNGKNRKLARDLLRAAGFRTLEAESGAGGIALAAEHLPDVILMDLRLPDMDGIDAARRLAEGARTARIPVVVLSAQPLEGNADRFLAAGFAGYIEKPIEVIGFADQLRRYRSGPGG